MIDTKDRLPDLAKNRHNHINAIKNIGENIMRRSHEIRSIAVVFDVEDSKAGSFTNTTYYGNANHCLGLAHRLVQRISND